MVSKDSYIKFLSLGKREKHDEKEEKLDRVAQDNDGRKRHDSKIGFLCNFIQDIDIINLVC